MYKVIDFLKGNLDSAKDILENKMRAYAEMEMFERAIEIRENLKSIEFIDARNVTGLNKHIDIDKKVAYDFPENFHIKSIIRGGLGNVVFDGNSHTIQNIDFNCCNENGQKVELQYRCINAGLKEWQPISNKSISIRSDGTLRLFFYEFI